MTTNSAFVDIALVVPLLVSCGSIWWMLRKRNMTESPLEDGDLIVGYPEEWRRFTTADKKFHEVLPKVINAVYIAFNRTFHTKSKADSVVFLLGSLIVEDFDEIMILSGNGRGFGSQRILRGMFERAVTAAYIHEHPDEAANFLNYFPIARFKLSQSLHNTLRRDVIDGATLAEHKALRDEVRGHYQTRCGFDGCCHKSSRRARLAYDAQE